MRSETAASAAAGDNSLKFCPHCKRVYLSKDERCGCGKKFAKKIETDAAAELVCVSSDKLFDIERCLQKVDIPYSLTEHSGYTAAIGKISGNTSVLVPLGFLKKSYTVLSEEGVGDISDSQLMNALPDDEVWEEMPAGKAAAVRTAAVIMFMVIVFLCVSGVDMIAAAIAKLFS